MTSRRVKKSVPAVLLATLMAAAGSYAAPTARQRSGDVSLGRLWLGLLQKHATFSGKPPAYPVEVVFSYSPPTEDHLRQLRDACSLDNVAGPGPETGRIINLMGWVHRLAGHANEPEIPKERNALNLIPLARDAHMALNCYLKTVILNEVYLAMGFESRQAHLLPHSNEEEESHFVASVYSRTLGKWILMDSDFGVYVTDEKGTLLGIAEIRGRLVSGRPLVVKGAGPPGQAAAGTGSNGQGSVDGTGYLWYLQKNIFKVRCPQESMFNLSARPNRAYFELIPDGYRPELLQAPLVSKTGSKTVYLNDEGLFWQRPLGRRTGPPGP